MRPELQGAVVTVFEEGLAVDAQEFFRSLNGDPPSSFSHGARKRVPQYGTALPAGVKFLNLMFIVLLRLDTNIGKLK